MKPPTFEENSNSALKECRDKHLLKRDNFASSKDATLVYKIRSNSSRKGEVMREKDIENKRFA